MGLFTPPPATRYDLQFSFAGIPIRVHPMFWVIALLFGLGSGGLLALLIWVPAVFVSILIHELGHALVMRRFGQSSSVVLYHGGGLTVPEQIWWGGRSLAVPLSPGQEILISLAGPFTGFFFTAVLLAASVAGGGTAALTFLFGVLPFPVVSLPVGGAILNAIVSTLIWINVFWGLVNLLPVFPLDGGQAARYLLLKLDPLNGVDRSLRISLITGVLMAVVSLVFFQNVFMLFLFGLLAYQSYQMLGGRLGGWSG